MLAGERPAGWAGLQGEGLVAARCRMLQPANAEQTQTASACAGASRIGAALPGTGALAGNALQTEADLAAAGLPGA